MKKLFALLLLPSIAFAGKIGENYVGVELGSSSIGFAYSDNDPTSVAIDSSGFSWEISANYNIYKPNAGKYGADLYLSYYNTTTSKGDRAQLWGLNDKKGNVSGSNGDAGQRTYFSAIFPRFSF